MANPFVHVELQTSDLAKARQFYGRLFDWKFEDVAPGGEYSLIQVGEGVGGGMMKVPNVPPHWLAYVLVDDVAASTNKAQELGAEVLVPPMAVGDFGKMSVFRDPTGAVLALWQALKKM